MKFNSFDILLLINCILGIDWSKDASFENRVNEPLNIVLNLNLGTRSHIKYLLELVRPLKEQGHNIILAAPSDSLHFGEGYNYTQFDFGPLYSELNIKLPGPKDDPKQNFIKMITGAYDLMIPHYPRLYKEIKPDLMICDFFADACIDFSKHHKIPMMVGFQALIHYVSNAPYLNALKFAEDLPLTRSEMTFRQRYYQTFIQKAPFNEANQQITSIMKELRQKYGIPSDIREIDDYSDIMKIANNYMGWEISRPIHPTLKLIGPIGTSNIVPLSDFDQFLDQRNKVVYMAFGSKQSLSSDDLTLVINSAYSALQKGIIDGVIFATVTKPEVFPKEIKLKDESNLDVTKLRNNEIEGFKFTKYAPQEAILKHKAVKLFVTHGGLESCFEGVSTLTPLLVMPFMADQPYNAKLVVHNGIGQKVNKTTETVEGFVKKINDIVKDQDGNIKKNLMKYKTISHYNSLGLEDAARFLHSFAQYAKICRKTQPDDAKIPCEMLPYITTDQHMPKYRAYNYDIYTFHYTIIFSILGLIIYSIKKFFFTKPAQDEDPLKQM